MNPKKPAMPEGQWSVTADEKKRGRELGRAMTAWLQDHFKGEKSVHVKILACAFQYIMDLQMQKSHLIGDDFIIAQEAVVAYGLADQLEEPLQDDPEPPAPDPEIEAATPKTDGPHAALAAALAADDQGPNGPHAAPVEAPGTFQEAKGDEPSPYAAA